ncbi:MAG: anthranilate synthase component I family protein [Candidatus Omnitrophica bacterium]|nr:anthranilate synthase component I family protein [Candidatus Omnitrophota bacterium]
MRRSPAATIHHGPLTVILQAVDGTPDLQPMLHSLPSTMPVIWCDSARRHAVTGRWSMLGCDPWLTCVARRDRVEVRTSAATHVRRANPLDALREIMGRYRAPARSQPYVRAIGLMGYLGYEMNQWIERMPEPQPAWGEVPDMLWYAMRAIVLVDHLDQRTWLLSVVDPHRPASLAKREALEKLEWLEEHVTRTTPTPTTFLACHDVPTLHPTSTPREFETMVSDALDHIRAGNIFQANVAQRFTTSWPADPRTLYDRLRRINPSPFACFLSGERVSIVSCSPERLVRVQEGRVDTRPIAGTRPRGATPDEDFANSLALLVSEKERAEHIMLVDLARNDLGRMCRTGSISVSELMTLEAYSHVIHIVSDVSGVLRRGVDPVDVIRAVFPGGTITGCPKVRCMQILRALEPVARGVYTGSLGYLGFDGTMDLNIAIRTIVLRDRHVSFHVGAGIVADSMPEREYAETLAKAEALIRALAVTADVSTQADAVAR